MEAHQNRGLVLSGKGGISLPHDDAWVFDDAYSADILFSPKFIYTSGSYTLKTVGNGGAGHGLQIDLVSLYDTGSFLSLSVSAHSRDTGSIMFSFVPTVDIVNNGNLTGSWATSGNSTLPPQWLAANDSTSAYVTESTIHSKSIRLFSNIGYTSTSNLTFYQSNLLIPNRVYWLSYRVLENIGTSENALTLYRGPGTLGASSGHSEGSSYLTLSSTLGEHSLTFSFEHYDDRTTRVHPLEFVVIGGGANITLKDITLREAHSSTNQIVRLTPGEIYYTALSRAVSGFYTTDSMPEDQEIAAFVYQYEPEYLSQSFKLIGNAATQALTFSDRSASDFFRQPISLGLSRKQIFFQENSHVYQMTNSGTQVYTHYHFNSPCPVMYNFDRPTQRLDNYAYPSTESVLNVYDLGCFQEDNVFGYGGLDPRYTSVSGAHTRLAENTAGLAGKMVGTLGAIGQTDFEILHGSALTDSQMAGASSVHGHRAFTVAALTKIKAGQFSPETSYHTGNCIIHIGNGNFDSFDTEFDASNYRIFTYSGFTKKCNSLAYIRRDIPAASTAFSNAKHWSASIAAGDGATGIQFSLTKTTSATYDYAGIVPTLYFTLYSRDTFKNAPLDASPTVNADPAWTMFRFYACGGEPSGMNITQSYDQWWLNVMSVRITTSVGANLVSYSATSTGASKEGMLEVYSFSAPVSALFSQGGSITDSSLFNMTGGDQWSSFSKNQFYAMILPEQDYWVDPIVVKSGTNTRNGLAGSGTDDTCLSGSNAIVSTSAMWCLDFTASTAEQITQSSWYTGSAFCVGTNAEGRSTFSGVISNVVFLPDTFFDHTNIHTWMRTIGPGGVTPPLSQPFIVDVLDSSVNLFSIHELGEKEVSLGIISQKSSAVNAYRLDQEAVQLSDETDKKEIGLI